MKLSVPKFVKKIIGIILITLGIAGLFLPLLQGILLIIIGASLLGNKHLIKIIKKIQAYFKKKSRKKK
jgi:hypothetical protein